MQTTDNQNTEPVTALLCEAIVRRFSDCGEDVCGECDVCDYLNFLEDAYSCAPAESTIQRNKEIDAYLNLTIDQQREIPYQPNKPDSATKERSD